MKKLCLIGLFLCLINLSLQAETSAPTVGIEGQITVKIPGIELIAKGVDRRSDIIVYIASSKKEKDAYKYDLRFIGQTPGTFNLTNYLLCKDGESTKDLEEITVTVKPLLPADDKGELIEARIRPIDIFGSYGLIFVLVWILWTLLLLPILLIRHRNAKTPRQVTAPAPTLAQLMEPLVVAATQGKLDTKGQANLEKMLILHWKVVLGQTTTDPYQAIQSLKSHAEAGKLLRKLEEWLHNPKIKPSKGEIANLLKPYKNAPKIEETATSHATSNPHDTEVK